MAQNWVQGDDYKLAGSGITSTTGTIVLQEMLLPDGKTPVQFTDFGTIGYGVLEPGTVREENISFSGITQNADGTATLTGCTRGLGFTSPYLSITAFKLPHAGATIFRLSNTATFYTQFGAKGDDNTWTGLNVFPSIEATRPRGLADTDTAINAAYVTLGQLSRTAFAGVSNASTTLKGIVQIATATQTASGTGTGSSGAVLVPDNANFNASSSAATLVPVTDASGKLSGSFGGNANGLATLDGSSKVVQDPVNATSTPTASKIVESLGTGKIDTGWINTGTGANQIVELNASSQLPAVDGSLLTGTTHFGAWDNSSYNSAGTNYLAPSNGIVIATVTSTGGGNCTVTGKSETSATPTTVRAAQTCPASSSATITYPVKSGDHFVNTVSANDSTFVVNFIPFA